nr:MotA/TolQ/ExbB proton channel family protein [Vibrio aquaticus]
MISTAIALSMLAQPVFADDLVSLSQQESKQQRQHNQVRESGFKQTEKELLALKAELVRQRSTLQAENEKLAATFSENEDRLARLEEDLRLETGSLGEVFGVVRQNAKELDSELHDSVTGAGKQSFRQDLEQIVAATHLPSMSQLTALWQAMQEQIDASGEFEQTEIVQLNGDGKRETVSAVRLGSFALVGEAGYLKWNGSKEIATLYPKQPENGPVSTELTSLTQGATQNVVVDPSRGIMLEQLALTPSAWDRLQAGGAVGKVIIALLLIGLAISLVRGLSLMSARQKISRQLKSPQTPTDNPLGRVLSVYSKDKSQTVEALELRLLEAVVDEQSKLEKGLSMLKLLAALAPMLGLLGTVTGMIETFQVITQFGNGDPKVMAGGISMALVTTVLGLIAAMPLLLAHNILSSQAESIRNILEKQGIALVAQQAEKAMDSEKAPLGNAA